MSSETPSEPAVPVDPIFADAEPARGRHPVLIYTALRLGLLLLVAGILYLVGLRDLWLLMFAFLLSGVLSIFVLDRRREVAAATMVGAVQKANQRIDDSARAEDAAVAAAAGTDAVTPEPSAGTPAAPAAPASPTSPAQDTPAAPTRRRDEIPADDDLDD